MVASLLVLTLDQSPVGVYLTLSRFHQRVLFNSSRHPSDFADAQPPSLIRASLCTQIKGLLAVWQSYAIIGMPPNLVLMYWALVDLCPRFPIFSEAFCAAGKPDGDFLTCACEKRLQCTSNLMNLSSKLNYKPFQPYQPYQPYCPGQRVFLTL